MKTNGPAYPVHAVEKSILIVNTLEKIGRPVGISELSSLTGMGVSIVHRHLDTLCYYRIVEQDPITLKYRLGMRLFELGESVQRQMGYGERVRPYLEGLVAILNETVNLSVLDQDHIIFIDKIECQATLRAVTHVGKTAPLYCSGMGKALLAFLPDEKRDALVTNLTLTPFTKSTITDLIKLRAHLQQIRSDGYALDDEEYYPGIRCVGVPILNHSGFAIASISVSGPTIRLTDERIESILPYLLSTAKAISEDLGFEKLMRSDI